MDSPTPLPLEINEPFIKSSLTTHKNNTNMSKTGVNQSQIDKLTIQIPFNYFACCIYGIMIIFETCVYLTLAFISGIGGIILGFSYILLIILVNLHFWLHKIEINRSNNITNVEVKNIYGCNKIKANGNIHFFYKYPSFIIINDSNFDLNTENIKRKPARIFYALKNIINMEAFLKIKNKFEVKCYENPFLFDIEKYMGKKREPSEKLFPKINKFMKFGEYFFTFYFFSPVGDKNIEYNSILNALFLVNILFFGMGVIGIFGDERSEVGFIIGCISLSLLIILPLFIILMVYYCTNCCSHDSRIDFVYSKDFSKIFIGIVKYKENSYSKTFEYQLDEIERFFFQEPEIINGDIDLKVEYKDKRIAQIHRFKILYKFEQEGIEYILNIKRNKVNSDSDIISK